MDRGGILQLHWRKDNDKNLQTELEMGREAQNHSVGPALNGQKVRVLFQL